MPATKIVFYREAKGDSPILDWLKQLRREKPKAYAKCVVRIRRLAELGHELRRPETDLLRDGIHELRARLGTVNYRILYFFHGRVAAILSHGLTKEDEVPDADIDRAVSRKNAFERNPESHTFAEGLNDE